MRLSRHYSRSAQGTENPTRTHTANGSGRTARGADSARRATAATAAAGVFAAPLILLASATAGLAGVGFATSGVAAADEQETPAERCQRQTNEYNASMEAAWRAAHPGKEPTGNEWPPFICHDVPTPSVPVPPPGGGGGTGDVSVPERTHRFEGMDRPEGEYRQDMALDGPRTGLSDRMNSPSDGAAGATDTTGRPSAGDSARSNVPDVPAWNATVADENGGTREVRVVDTPDGPAVVNPDGTATGEILATDTGSGDSVVQRRDGLEGQQLVDPAVDTGASGGDRAGDQTGVSSTAASAPGATQSEGAASDVADGEDNGSETGVPAGPLGAGGALAGAAGAVLAERRRGGAGRRGARNGSHQADIDWGNGREQSLILLEGPDSPREYRFDMDVPEGGRMVKNPDGSVDVVDAQGNVTEHVKAPWAYDALGRPVETHYEVDNETGELVQIVDPERSTALPILADPDKDKKEPLKPSDPGFVGPVLAEDAQAQKETREAEGYVPTAQEAQDSRFPDGPPQYMPAEEQRNESAQANSTSGNNSSQFESDTSHDNETSSGPPAAQGAGTAGQPPLTESATDDGLPVARGANGEVRIDPLGLNDDIETERFEDGSAQATWENGDQVRIFPAQSAEDMQDGREHLDSVSYDAERNTTTQTTTTGNGESRQYTKPGRPDSAGPTGSPEARGALNPISMNPQGMTPQPEEESQEPPIVGQSVPGYGVVDPDGINEQSRLDRTLPQRQPEFIGPVTADDAAGQARNRATEGEFPTGRNSQDPRFPGEVYGIETDGNGNPTNVDGREISDYFAPNGQDLAGAIYDTGTGMPLELARNEVNNDANSGTLSRADAGRAIRAIENSGRLLGAAGTGVSIASDVQNGESVPEAAVTNGAGAAAATGFGIGIAALGAAISAPAVVTGAVVVVGGAGVAWGVTQGAKYIWDGVFDSDD